MCERPNLDINLSSQKFRQYYYLKEECVEFCRKYGLQTTGSKLELIERIAEFLDTGKRSCTQHKKKKISTFRMITLDTVIDENMVCSETLRAFYKEQIGDTFTFIVPFQKWLKENPGKTVQDSILAYYQLLDEKKKNKVSIDQQFEYNTYIRDFFHNNKDKTFQQAIQCWKYKKSLKGNHQYEKDDLKALNRRG